MATLRAAAGPVPLDNLLARVRPAPKPSVTPLRYIERSTLRSLDTPALAVVLCITVATCATCHSIHRMPGKHVLVRFDEGGLSNAVHYRPSECSKYAHLPHERREFPIDVPYCESCFPCSSG